MSRLDILMVTHDQPEYVKLSLPRLLQTCDEDMRVWIWHNGTHEETLELSRTLADDPRVARFHHSPENRPLRDPTNWLFANSRAEFLSKVEDDCLVSQGWAQAFMQAHRDFDGFGAIGSWRFRRWYYPFVFEEDMDDPRSEFTRFRTDEDLRARLPLTARYNGITTLAQWREQIVRTAHASQAATLDHRYYRGWRLKRHNLWLRLRRLAGEARKW